MVKELGLPIVPVPFVVQTTLLWLVAPDPTVISTAPPLKHANTFVPASAVGAAVIVSVLVDVAAAQFPFPLAVKVNVISPPSPSPGVYVAVVNEVALAIVPEPSDVQSTLLWFVAPDPVVIFTAPAFEQVGDNAVPASAVGGAIIVSVLVDVTGAQFPFPLAVKVNVILPLSPPPGL